MNCKSIVLCIVGSLIAASACDDQAVEKQEELLVAESNLKVSSSLLQSRCDLIKSVHSSHAYIHNPLIFAGIAYTESSMAHCYSEYYSQVSSLVCSGPYAADCGGAVTAGYWDGPCYLQEGGLGMWQFDEGTAADTIYNWSTYGYWNGQTHDILSLSDSTAAAIDFVLAKAWYSSHTPYFSSHQAMYDWINSIRPVDEDPDYETWLGFLSNSYNGYSWGSTDWYNTKEQYRSNTNYVYNQMGGDAYWYGSNCGSPCTVCILNQRSDILPFYASHGWDTSCGNRDAIIANWCSIAPGECQSLKAGTCSSVCDSQWVNVLSGPGELVVNHGYYSANSWYRLVMQTDGNLVLYDGNNNAMWHSHTYGNSGAKCYMQSDGNLVIYSQSGQALWHTHTYGNSGAILQISNDGKIRINKNGQILWQS